MSNKNLPRKKRSKIYLVPVEDLREVVKNSNSISAILKYFNISSSSGSYSAIAKWIKYYDLTRPPAGYWKKKINNP